MKSFIREIWNFYILLKDFFFNIADIYRKSKKFKIQAFSHEENQEKLSIFFNHIKI